MNTKKSYFGLPSEVKFCKKCVISNQRPSSTIEFKNKEGLKRKLLTLMMMGFVQHVSIMTKKKKELIGMIATKNLENFYLVLKRMMAHMM